MLLVSKQLKDLVEVVVRELVSTQHSITDDELLRAKTQLQSMLLMNLESRPIVFEDVGRQVLANGCRLTPQHYYELIGQSAAAGILFPLNFYKGGCASNFMGMFLKTTFRPTTHILQGGCVCHSL